MPTVAALDSLAEHHELDDYPRSGSKADKLAALADAGIDVDYEAEHEAEAPPSNDQARVSDSLAKARDAERERVRKLDADRKARDLATREPRRPSQAVRDAAEATRRRELAGLDDRVVGGPPPATESTPDDVEE